MKQQYNLISVSLQCIHWSACTCMLFCIDAVGPEILLEIATQLSHPDVSDDAVKRLPQALGLSLGEEEWQEKKRKLGLRGMFLLMFLLWEEKKSLWSTS